MTLSKRALFAVPLVAALTLAACGGDDDDDAADPGTGSLAASCPNPLIIQTDWNPEAEHGAAYRLVGEGYQIDADKKVVRGPLVAPDGTATGVDIEVRVGGPAIGFKQVTAQLYEDQDIFLGFVSTDEAVQNSADLPTKAVLAPLEKNPQILMWGPEAFPGVTAVADLPDDTLVVTFGPAVYQDWLVAQGIIARDQIDGSYNASPARFVGEKGAIAQQGFASAEPYIYENEVPEWGKPVQFQLIHDMGFEVYSQALAGRPAVITERSDCLKAFVPIYQAAQADYVKNPATTNELILELVEAYDTGWVYTQGVADFSVKQQLDLGLVGNGPDSTLGNMEEDRVTKIITELEPIFADQGKPIKEGLTFDDIATNEFVDPDIGL